MEESQNRCKKMVYEECENYVDKLEKDAGQIYEYFGKYFIGLQNRTTSTFATLTGENLAKAGGHGVQPIGFYHKTMVEAAGVEPATH